MEMSVQTETHGCLACNKEEVEAMLLANGADLTRFTQVPRPRHAWGDVLCCSECGAAWLIAPKPLPQDGAERKP